MCRSAPWWLACYIFVKEAIKPVKIDGFPRADESAIYNNLPYAGFAEGRARTVYKGLYNWPNETIGKQHKQRP